jgi:hypothetical protein
MACSEAYGRQDRLRRRPEQWLQSTFANRYHKFRKVHGKLFQGRYKSLIVEVDGYLGALLRYTHLNPVQAGMTDVAGLRDYQWSSYWYLNHPAKRPEFIDCSGALLAAGSHPADPKVPQCGSLMALRTARQGKNDGSQYWGYTQYPRSDRSY